MTRALVEALKSPLKAIGFKYDGARGGFFKPEPFGFCMFMWGSRPIATEGGAQAIRPGLGVRHDIVDNVVNQLGHIWGDDNRRYTTTVYRDMGFFPFDPARDGEKRIRHSAQDEDVAEIVANFMDLLGTDGAAFYRHYSDLAECSKGLNSPIDADTHPLFNVFPQRAYYGVVAATFAEPHRVPGLIQAYGDVALRGVVDGKTPDAGLYDVGNERQGADAVIARLEFVAAQAAVVGANPRD